MIRLVYSLFYPHRLDHFPFVLQSNCDFLIRLLGFNRSRSIVRHTDTTVRSVNARRNKLKLDSSSPTFPATPRKWSLITQDQLESILRLLRDICEPAQRSKRSCALGLMICIFTLESLSRMTGDFRCKILVDRVAVEVYGSNRRRRSARDTSSAKRTRISRSECLTTESTRQTRWPVNWTLMEPRESVVYALDCRLSHSQSQQNVHRIGTRS